jgi:hypothetical protein
MSSEVNKELPGVAKLVVSPEAIFQIREIHETFKLGSKSIEDYISDRRIKNELEELSLFCYGAVVYDKKTYTIIRFPKLLKDCQITYDKGMIVRGLKEEIYSYLGKNEISRVIWMNNTDGSYILPRFPIKPGYLDIITPI